LIYFSRDPPIACLLLILEYKLEKLRDAAIVALA